MEKSSTGLDENVAGLLCYVLGWVSGLVFILIEQQSKFVRYHAMQSIYIFGTITVVAVVLGWIPFIGQVISIIISLIGLALWIFLMIRAYQGQKPKVLWAGDLAEKWVQKKGD
ncbi:MAG TPA: DUF4870 domain-containing protein [Dehalococcoidales bacterium]|nr:DUF4870 domain-containing protein [Dehalococcoidales bacterium]